MPLSYLKLRQVGCRRPRRSSLSTSIPCSTPSCLFMVLLVVFMTSSSTTTTTLAFSSLTPLHKRFVAPLHRSTLLTTTLDDKRLHHRHHHHHQSRHKTTTTTTTSSWSALLSQSTTTTTTTSVDGSMMVPAAPATMTNTNVNIPNRLRSDDDEMWYYANGIIPKTKPLGESIVYYAQFVLDSFQKNRLAKKLQREQKWRIEYRRRCQQQQLQQSSSFWRRFLPWSSNKPVELDEAEDEHWIDSPVSAYKNDTDTSLQAPSWRETLTLLNEQRRHLVALAGYNTAIVVPSFTFLVLGSLMNSIIPHYYSKCLQCVATLEPSRHKLLQALIGLAVSSTLGAVFTGLRGCLFWIAGSRANYNVRVKLHRNLLLQEAAFFDRNEVGYLLSRLNNDVNKIGMVISFHVNVVLRQLAQFIFGSIFLIRISPRLSMWAFAGIALVAWVSAIYGEFARGLAQTVQDTFAEGTAVAETSLTMSETIRAFDGVSVESKRYEQAQGHALELEEVQAWAYGSHKFISDTLQSILQVGLLLACWVLGRSNGLPASQLTTFIFYANFVLESSNEVGDQWAKIQGAIGASSSVFDLIRRIPLVRDPVEKALAKAAAEKQHVHLNADVVPKIHIPLEVVSPAATITTTTTTTTTNGTPMNRNGHELVPIISMHNVTIQYDAMDSPAVNGVDLNIYPGDRVAIVGRSGSGKSSMLRSILRFYDPSSGSIQLDGQDLRNMSRLEIASKIAVVEQEPSLFPMSLLENVLYGIEKDAVDDATGLPYYSDEYRQAVCESLRLAGLPVHAGNDLGLELDTRVGEGGRTLSGGQRQRVAIARALVREPEVLLLDEPTAALDSQSEAKVIQALLAAMEHAKSMVMVTHRLGMIRKLNVNRIIVMEKGRIVESGHPETLLRDPNGLYTSLAREQGVFTTPVAPAATSNSNTNDTLSSSSGVVHSYL